MEKNKLEKLLTSVDKLLKFFSEKKEEKFEAIKVKDGDTMVEYSALEVGADVSISTATGSEVAPDGSYSLSNDVAFTVKDGKISEITSQGDVAPAEDTPAETLADVPVDAPAIAETPAEETKEDEAVKALTDRVSALEETIKNLMESINAVPSKQDVSELKSELMSAYSKIQELSKIPTQFSADTRVEVKDSEMDKYRKLAEKYSK
ncbi:hypothetical protein [Mucilaginibacter psychrotolerans]|uniref:Uncharacterized protein n=1 Tax=Mucilaginibacter psychrotolerans TaxID=1524096 RepID=A0A4Y8S7E4_9SPHI|nr:hypothetical protein [Mucilaginibacter psychrotolerans]TFF34387.1 hypothetical protein E2R66_22190 [Mucilaginibacter psychrotolerans]